MKTNYTMGYAELQQPLPKQKINYAAIDREISYIMAAFAGLGAGAVTFLALLYWGVL